MAGMPVPTTYVLRGSVSIFCSLQVTNINYHLTLLNIMCALTIHKKAKNIQ